MMSLIHVAVGVVVDKQNNILLAQRQTGQHLSGLWEFPGGKCEADETVQDALKRELSEEIGIDVLSAQPLIQIPYHYANPPPGKSVLLDVWKVDAFSGEPYGKEGQTVQWVPIEKLNHIEMPPANKPIITAMALPEVYWITSEFETKNKLLASLEEKLMQNIKLIQYRQKQIQKEQTHFD